METIIKLSKEEKKAIREKELAIKAEQELLRQAKALEHFKRISRASLVTRPRGI